MQRNPSNTSHVLVISGLPGSGKTWAATRMTELLCWPLLAKDDFKERLFDALGAGDAELSRRLSSASYALMFELARQFARSRIDCILEGNFRWTQTRAAFESLQGSVRFIQLWCTAPVDVLAARLRMRAREPMRHPGHRDSANLDTLLTEIAAPAEPLPLPGELVTLDGVGNAAAKLAELAAALRAPGG